MIQNSSFSREDREVFGDEAGALTRQAGSHRSQAGSMLLIALAVLTLLSIIAVTFVALMRLELKATENFRDKSRAQLLSKSAESAVISMLRSRPFWDMPRLMNRTNAPWIYGLIGGNGFSREGGLLSLKESEGDESSLASNL